MMPLHFHSSKMHCEDFGKKFKSEEKKISMDRFSCSNELINQTVFILMTLKDSTVLLCLYLPDPAAFIASASVLGCYISFAEGLFIQLWK